MTEVKRRGRPKKVKVEAEKTKTSTMITTVKGSRTAFTGFLLFRLRLIIVFTASK